jgi:hypothetical protein
LTFKSKIFFVNYQAIKHAPKYSLNLHENDKSAKLCFRSDLILPKMVAGFGWAARMFEYCRSGSFSIDANSDTGEWQQNNGDGGELVNTFQSDGPQSGQEFNDTIIEGLRQARIENQSRASGNF